MSFGAIKARIMNELVRPDLTSEIALAISDAIKEASKERFWFNELRGISFDTVAGQDFYDVHDLADIPLIGRIDSLSIVTPQGQRWNLDYVNHATFDRWHDGDQIFTPTPSAPTITTDQNQSVPENARLAVALTADELVSWLIAGGPDAAQFEIVGSVLRWAGNGTKDFEAPTDANHDNVYTVLVSAVDPGGQASIKALNIAVTDVADTIPHSYADYAAILEDA